MPFDSHCHLSFYDAGDVEKIVLESAKAGIKVLINISTEVTEFSGLLDLCNSFSGIYCSAGVHPNNVQAASVNDATYEVIVSFCKNNKKVIAIGETGLDYYYDYTPPALQRESFLNHIKIAKDFSLPVIVHSRKAEKDTAIALESLIKKNEIPVILHSFASSRELFEAACANGWYISFSGIVTFKNAEEIQQIARDTPLDKILIETDAPYLAPVPVRGQKNYPYNVQYVLQHLSKLKDIPVELLSKQLIENFCRVFTRVPKEIFTT